MQGELRVSNDLLRAMLDQETGLRGYALTGEREFLEPYDAGRSSSTRRCATPAAQPRARDAGFVPRPRRGSRAAGRRTRGRRSTRSIAAARGGSAIDDAHERKALMDRIRSEGASLRAHVGSRPGALQRSRWVFFVLRRCCSRGVLGCGCSRWAPGRARAARAASSGASTSGRCRAPTTRARRRSCCAAAPSGSRPARARSCSRATRAATRWRRATDPAEIAGLGEGSRAPPARLPGRPPRRRLRAPAGAQPLQTCELCGRIDGALALHPVARRRRGHRLAARRQGPRDQAGRARAGRRRRGHRRPPRSSPTCATSRSPSTARPPTR